MVNNVLRSFGTGAFHCGVEVYSSEWSYSDVSVAPGEEKCSGTGIFCCRPRVCEGHTYIDSIPMGRTNLSEGDVLGLIMRMRKDWSISDYSTLTKNCCHFCDILCQRLGVGPIPSWITTLAATGATIAHAGDTVCCQTAGSQAARNMFCCGTWRSARGGQKYFGEDGAEVVQVDIVETLPVLPPSSARSEYSRADSRGSVESKAAVANEAVRASSHHNSGAAHMGSDHQRPQRRSAGSLGAGPWRSVGDNSYKTSGPQKAAPGVFSSTLSPNPASSAVPPSAATAASSMRPAGSRATR